MKFPLSIFLVLIGLTLFTSACAGGQLVSSWPGLTTDGETVFLASGAHVYAINASNGGETWRFPEEPDNKLSFYAPPTLTEDGHLIVGGYNNVLYRLDAATGEPDTWTFTGSRNRYIGSALATDQLVLAPSADRNLYALDINAESVWNFTTAEPQWAQPATDGETVYLTSLDHYLYAVDLQTGEEMWKVDLGGAVVGSPLVGDGVVYAGSFANTLSAYNTQTGDVLWTFPTTNWIWAGPALNGETLYFGDIDGSFYAVDAETGVQTWNYKADGGIFSTPLIVNDRVYFATEAGNVYAFSLDGEQIWPQQIGGKIYTSPIAVNNLILIATMENEKVLIALDENGIERWNFPPVEN